MAEIPDLERDCGPAADGGWLCAPYAACTHPGGCLLGDLADPEPADDRGPVVPIAPNSERDARREIYRDRERRRAARALDRWLEATYPLAGDGASAEAIAVAGERFVEAIGDYVLARLGEGMAMVSVDTESIHQKAHYGVADLADRCDHGREVGERSGMMAHLDDGTLCDRASRDVLRGLRADTDNTPKSDYGAADEPGSTGPSYGAGPGEGR